MRRIHGESPNPSGLCMCGCGRQTEIAKQSRTGRGWIKGEHKRYILGHAGPITTRNICPQCGGRKDVNAGQCRACWRAAHRRDDWGGYIQLRRPGHPMAKHGIVMEHRMVVYDAGIDPTGKYVHHINGDRQDNRLENLEVMDSRTHRWLHAARDGVRNKYGVFNLGGGRKS